MFFYVQRLRKQPQLPIAEGVRAKQTVLTKVRKGQPMTRDELEYATQVVGNQRTLMTFAIPLTVFSLGCFYVLGSLEQLHGATPSERTFLGVIAMVSSINITAHIFPCHQTEEAAVDSHLGGFCELAECPHLGVCFAGICATAAASNG